MRYFRSRATLSHVIIGITWSYSQSRDYLYHVVSCLVVPSGALRCLVPLILIIWYYVLSVVAGYENRGVYFVYSIIIALPALLNSANILLCHGDRNLPHFNFYLGVTSHIQRQMIMEESFVD